jgi:hypothetical protein
MLKARCGDGINDFNLAKNLGELFGISDKILYSMVYLIENINMVS